jgi:nucleotide-binding universal stress UspA family protein
MKILIGYDGSDFANAAIDDLQYAGLPSEAEAVIMSVTDVWELPEVVEKVSSARSRVSRDRIDAIEKHLQGVVAATAEMAGSAAERVRSMFPGWEVRSVAQTGKAAWELIAYSDEWAADLLVVGSHGRGFLGRALLGSVSMKILHESRCSVRIARKRSSPEAEPLRVLVATDGSANAELTIQTVVGRRWPENTLFRLITADDDPASRPETCVLDHVPDGREDSPAAKEWLERVLERPRKAMEAAGLNVSQNCRWGDARRIILDEGTNWNADCIFVGARGLSRFRRLLIGSVSAAVAARAGCSVEVVRPIPSDRYAE